MSTQQSYVGRGNNDLTNSQTAQNQAKTSHNADQRPLRIVVHRQAKFLQPADIAWVQSIGINHVLIHLCDGQQWPVHINIGHLAKQLPLFWRLRASHLVNPDQVITLAGLVRYEGKVELHSGLVVTIPKHRRPWVYQLMQKGGQTHA